MLSSKKQIYLVFSCNGSKFHDSESLIMATTSVRKLKSFLTKEIENGYIDYSNGITETPKRMAAKFRKEFDLLSRREINDRLAYAYIDYCYDGEEI